MEKTVQGIALVCASFICAIICETDPKVCQKYTNCQRDAAALYEGIVDMVCKNKSISEPDKWLPEICKDICTTEALFSDCTDGGEILFYISDGTVTIFPKPKFKFQGCAHCHNLSHINITCSSKIECMEKRNTNEKPEIFQKVEEVSLSLTSPQTTKSSQPEATSSTTGIPVEFAVAAAVSGCIIGILATIGVWLLRKKLGNHESWKSAVLNPTYNHYASSDLPDPVGDLYTKVDKHNTLVAGGGIYNHSSESCTDDGIYNHLNETRTNREVISSPYDHAPYIHTRLQQTDCLDSDYMHINKVK